MQAENSVRRVVLVAVSAAALLLVLAGPALGHVLVVAPPGSDPKVGWVGGPAVPGNGKGLVPGGEDGTSMLPAAHGKGLNNACVRNGSSVVDIWGPANPATCEHGPPPG